jgi:hypothetical protein
MLSGSSGRVGALRNEGVLILTFGFWPVVRGPIVAVSSIWRSPVLTTGTRHARALLVKVCSFSMARNKTTSGDAGQQRVSGAVLNVPTTDTVTYTVISACRMQRQVAEGQCPPTILSWRPTCRI